MSERIKGFISGIVVSAMVLALAGTVFAEAETRSISAFFNNIRLVIGSEETELRDAQGAAVEPFIYNGTTYAPIRSIAETFGRQVAWDGDTYTAYIGGGNFSDEMKIPYTPGVDLDEYGADSIERMFDHVSSPYFSQIDPYNMTSTETLTILPQFKTQQQTSEWSCGVTAALMVMDYFGMLGDWNEETLSELRPQGSQPSATKLSQMIDIFEGRRGFTLETTVDFALELEEAAWDAPYLILDMINGYLTKGIPVLICWNDWGGHWQVIIGYDTMGTEDAMDDVIIVADPYDTTDHNQDGYGVYPAMRFGYTFSMYREGWDELAGDDYLFVAAYPAG